MIESFAHKRTATVFLGKLPKGFPGTIGQAALKKLRMIDAAGMLDDLRSPPGNRLEMLLGDRRGQHSIRINDQWRICFVWRANAAHSVEIVDYHH
ncbi:MAG: type II toxin-antitoxin system RelE/ParE family toxin [Janthinobacterium lividum]